MGLYLQWFQGWGGQEEGGISLHDWVRALQLKPRLYKSYKKGRTLHAGAEGNNDIPPTTVVIEPTYSMRKSILIPES